MKKALFVVLVSCFISGSAIVKIAHAEAAQTERWVCLEAVGDWTKDQWGQTLKAKGGASGAPLPNAKTYIVECISTDAGQICTLGTEALDLEVYGPPKPEDDNKTHLQQLGSNFEFYGMYNSYRPNATEPSDALNPLMSDAGGGLGDLFWRAKSDHLDRKFFALNYVEPVTAAGAGAAGALQNGTFTFDQANMAKDCAAINWDPYGRVFDSQTLEPIGNVSVTLLFKKNNIFVPMTPSDLVGGNIQNPQTTLIDGKFSFVVPDGEYKLVVGSPFQFTSSLSEVHANYLKAYSDPYPFVPTDINGIIVEKGAIQHRDIPVKTRGTNTTPKMMSYFYDADRRTGNSVVSGVVSHPLSKIVAHSVKVSTANPKLRIPYREIGSTLADKLGRFSLSIDQGILESKDDYIELFDNIEIIKVDVRTFASSGIAAAHVHFEPILQYLEGFTFSSNGTALSNATVEVYKTMSNKPYSTTKTDENGYFKVTSEFLPTDPYELRYVTATGNVVKSTTSNFIATNQETIVTNKIDIYGYRDQKNKTVADLVKPTKTIASTNGGRNANMTGINNQTTGQNNGTQSPVVNALGQNIGILIAIIVLIIIGVVVVVVMMKKKTPPVDGMVQ